MVRRIAGFAAFAVMTLVGVKLVFVVLGLALTLLSKILWLAAMGFVFYLVLRIVSPGAAQRVRETVLGEDPSPESG